MYRVHPRCLPSNRLHNLITLVAVPLAATAALLIVAISTRSGLWSFVTFLVTGHLIAWVARFVRCVNCSRCVGYVSVIGVIIPSWSYAPRRCVFCGFDHHSSRTSLSAPEEGKNLEPSLPEASR